jgi:hypothetical protein
MGRKGKQVVARARRQWQGKVVWLSVKPGFECLAQVMQVAWKFGRVVLLLNGEHQGGSAWFNANRCRLDE